MKFVVRDYDWANPLISSDIFTVYKAVQHVGLSFSIMNRDEWMFTDLNVDHSSSYNCFLHPDENVGTETLELSEKDIERFWSRELDILPFK